MTIFAVQYSYVDDDELMTSLQPQHREWLQANPGLKLAGRFQPGSEVNTGGHRSDAEATPGALIIIDAQDLGAAVAWCDQDPYWGGGYIAQRIVRTWEPPLGPWAADETMVIG